MTFSGVEMLKLQFSRAVDQTFEHFLDSWAFAPLQEDGQVHGYREAHESGAEIPVITNFVKQQGWA